MPRPVGLKFHQGWDIFLSHLGRNCWASTVSETEIRNVKHVRGTCCAVIVTSRSAFVAHIQDPIGDVDENVSIFNEVLDVGAVSIGVRELVNRARRGAGSGDEDILLSVAGMFLHPQTQRRVVSDFVAISVDVNGFKNGFHIGIVCYCLTVRDGGFLRDPAGVGRSRIDSQVCRWRARQANECQR